MIEVFLKKATVPFFVFITGACVLIIEITATRVLAPYFGNTIFAISSVISVVLAALSLGYYVGGKLADKYPKEELFYGIIALSGFCIIFLHVLGIIFLSLFGYKLSLMEGPIISSVLLFFLQSFLLGMLSPFAIKLQAMRLQTSGIGSVSGTIFFWSTAGSIAGSLLAGFFLIPHIGLNAIILGTGFILIILGLYSFLKIPLWSKLLLMLALVVLFFSSINIFYYANHAVYVKDGVYQKIIIYDDRYQGKPTRFLQQDRNSSAAAFINSDDLVYEYTKYYALYQIFNSDIKNALMIGGGAYSVPKALLNDLPDVHINVAEIEPSLFELGKKYFNVPDDPRLVNTIEDGRRLLYDSPQKYDMIFSDAYASFYSTPEHLTTREFFQMAKNKLNKDGIFIANVVGSLSFSDSSLLFSEMRTFEETFPNSYYFAVNSTSSQTPQNIIFAGYNSDAKINIDDPALKENKNPIIGGLAEKEIDIASFDLSKYPVLTDDFSPVEYLTAQELKKIR